jgi:uncharacterized membrane protein YhaH (DUF805 family)
MNSVNWQFLFLSANGRIGQKDFWIGFAILFVAGLVLGMIPVLGMLIGLALIYPNICLYSKRLHDFGKTGWLAALPYVVLLIAGVIAGISGGAAMVGAMSGNAAGAGAAAAGLGMSMGILALAGLVGLGFLLWVGLTKGDPAPNQYGAPTPSMFGGGATSTPSTV